VAELVFQRRVVVAQGAGDTEAHGLGLPHEAAADAADDDIELAFGVGDAHGGGAVGAVAQLAEVLVDGLEPLAGDLNAEVALAALGGPHADASDSALAPAGAPPPAVLVGGDGLAHAPGLLGGLLRGGGGRGAHTTEGGVA